MSEPPRFRIVQSNIIGTCESARTILKSSNNSDRDVLEQKFYKLINAPHTLTQHAFEHLLNIEFAGRLTNAEKYDLICDRIRKCEYNNSLEHHALLAYINRDDAELNRLLELL